MKKFITFALALTYSALTFASYPEMFGSSFSTTAIGNQTNLDANDPSNNYYVPAVLGFSDKVNVLMQATATNTFFKKISNITVTNNTNSNVAATTGDVSNQYPGFYGGSLHFALPIGYQHLGTLGLSIYTPIGNLMETNSGNPFLPEYVMYHSRYRRTSVYLNFARKWSDDLAWSVGSILGFQASAEAKTNLSLNGAAYGSWGQARSKISPALGLITSIVKKFDHLQTYFSYQQEMKSNLHVDVAGEITNPNLPIFEAGIDTMIFYDPHTFRLGAGYNFGDEHSGTELFGSVDYQIWSNYKTPTIFITKTGGAIVSSNNYEHVKIRDTINPKLGIKIPLTARWSTGLGVAYRMTPLGGDFSGSGNSIDSNTYIATAGLQYRVVVWSKDVILGSSVEYQKLEKKHVVKSTGEEDGSTGPKIGDGGYDIDGHIVALSFGIKFNF